MINKLTCEDCTMNFKEKIFILSAEGISMRQDAIPNKQSFYFGPMILPVLVRNNVLE